MQTNEDTKRKEEIKDLISGISRSIDNCRLTVSLVTEKGYEDEYLSLGALELVRSCLDTTYDEMELLELAIFKGC